MAKLLYQGHGSYRITTDDNRIIYVDPFAGEGYDLPADIILVTHQHGDHNQINKVMKKNGCILITNEEALKDGMHNSFSINGINIGSVEASNCNHDPHKCVGFIITVDNIKIYASGDTSKTKQMEAFHEMKLDYALLPCDGIYNMDIDEAVECADMIGARHSIPIHMKPGELFDKERAELFRAKNRMIVLPGQEIIL